MKSKLQTALAIALLFLAAIAAIAALDGCALDSWDPPNPVVKEVGNPCGYNWHSCHDGKCCQGADTCLQGGGCEFGGISGPTWGAARGDGGVPEKRIYRALTPDEVRRSEGR